MTTPPSAISPEILNCIRYALAEDVGSGDVTTNAIVPADVEMKGRIIAKQDGIVAGLDVARAVYEMVDPRVRFSACVDEGAHVQNRDLLEDVKRELLDSVAIAHSAGINDENIFLDPGIGFGKTVEQNLALLNRLDEIKALGYPVLQGPSRKSFIGYTLDLPPEEHLEGTTAAVAVGITRGADIVRVHDATFMTRVIRMTDAIGRGKPGVGP